MSHDDAGRKGCWDTESLALVVERQKFPPKKGKGIEKELDSQKTQMPREPSSECPALRGIRGSIQ